MVENRHGQESWALELTWQGVDRGKSMPEISVKTQQDTSKHVEGNYL